jgi:uncharacterized membrane protein
VDIQDKQLQKVISVTLRTGVATAVLIGLLGGILYLQAHGREPISFRTFAGANTAFASPSEVFHQALFPHNLGSGRRGLAIAQVGIICLLLTPITRVALSIVGFAMERDRVYVLITGIVLCTLICSMLLH